MRGFISLIIAAGFIFIGIAHASPEKDRGVVQSNKCEQSVDLLKATESTISTAPEQQCLKADENGEEKLAGRGCCSWHGGVCGCSSSGRAVCCDGVLSPSCGC